MARQVGDYTLQQALRAGGWLFAIAFILSFLFNVLRLTGPLFMILIYDRVLSSRSEETLVALFALVVTFMLVMGLLDYSRRRLMARFGAQFQERLELQIFNTAGKDKLFVAGQNKPASGLNELDGLRGFFHSQAIIAVFDFIWAPMFLVVVFALHWLLGWVAVGGVGLLVLLAIVRALSSSVREEKAKAASQEITELKDMMKHSTGIVRGQQMTGSFKTRWLQARQESRDKSVELKDWTTWFTIFSRQIRMLAQYSVLAVGAYLALSGKLSIGAMVACTFLVVRVLLPVEQFLNQLPNIRRAIANWGSLKKILKTQAQLKYENDSDTLEATLVLSSVSARSSITRQQVLKGINLTVSPGQIIEITGGSDGGKTMLAETILGAWPKSAGSILCGGTNVERLTSKQLGKFFGYVPEIADFVKGTIKENIGRLELEPDMDKIVAAAERAGVHDAIMALPKGYETDLGAADIHFSKGQKNQIALARALYNVPKVLIIDEPDSFLRRALSGKRSKLLDDLKSAGSSVVILTRESLSLANCDAEFHLDDGRMKSRKLAKNVTSLDTKKAEKKKVTQMARG